MAKLETILSFGGRRLAITEDGNCCIAAAYHVEGIAAYSVSEGTEIWRRKDLKKAQSVKVSHDNRRVYCGFDNSSLHVLNRDTGKTIRTLPGIRDVWENPYQPMMLLEKRELVLRGPNEEKIATIGRESFAVLSVAFAPGCVCISEAGGPLRCFGTQDGIERWRYAEEGRHFVWLAFAEKIGAFFGVCWPYTYGGEFRLLRFESESGRMSVVRELGPSGEFAFCQRGARLISSDGTHTDTATGHRVKLAASWYDGG